MTERVPIEIQVAKNELVRINSLLSGPRLLIGGLAVQRYVVTRDSKDIDLVCEYQEALKVVGTLYPTYEWDVREVNDDAYRPSFEVRHLYKNCGKIVFGPKVTERTPYRFINWQYLLENGVPYVIQGRSLEKVIIPRCSDLAYTKLISFLGRTSDKVDKRKHDLEDMTDLSNHHEFLIRDFLAVIAMNHAEKYVKDNFALTDNEKAIFSNSSFERQAAIFGPPVGGTLLASLSSPILCDEAQVPMMEKSELAKVIREAVKEAVENVMKSVLGTERLEDKDEKDQ